VILFRNVTSDFDVIVVVGRVLPFSPFVLYSTVLSFAQSVLYLQYNTTTARDYNYSNVLVLYTSGKPRRSPQWSWIQYHRRGYCRSLCVLILYNLEYRNAGTVQWSQAKRMTNDLLLTVQYKRDQDYEGSTPIQYYRLYSISCGRDTSYTVPIQHEAPIKTQDQLINIVLGTALRTE